MLNHYLCAMASPVIKRQRLQEEDRVAGPVVVHLRQQRRTSTKDLSTANITHVVVSQEYAKDAQLQKDLVELIEVLQPSASGCPSRAQSAPSSAAIHRYQPWLGREHECMKRLSARGSDDDISMCELMLQAKFNTKTAIPSNERIASCLSQLKKCEEALFFGQGFSHEESPWPGPYGSYVTKAAVLAPATSRASAPAPTLL
eukprot:gene17750-24110_t